MGVPIQLTGDSCQDCLRLDIESTGDADFEKDRVLGTQMLHVLQLAGR